MQCPERDLLWEAYNQSLDTLLECTKRVETANATALSASIISASAARTLCESARASWEERLRTHACDEKES